MTYAVLRHHRTSGMGLGVLFNFFEHLFELNIGGYLLDNVTFFDTWDSARAMLSMQCHIESIMGKTMTSELAIIELKWEEGKIKAVSTLWEIAGDRLKEKDISSVPNEALLILQERYNELHPSLDENLDSSNENTSAEEENSEDENYGVSAH